MTSRSALRSTLRMRRQALDADLRIDAALAIAHRLVALLIRVRFQRIAGFVASDGEADPGPGLSAARTLGREIYLPVLDRLRAPGMKFVRTEVGQALSPNRFGIPEPESGESMEPAFLDLVLVPLVGFDHAGNRLGMGAGYYDRCFAFLRSRSHWRRPLLLGVGFECQGVQHIETRPWDVGLDGILTESRLNWFE